MSVLRCGTRVLDESVWQRQHRVMPFDLALVARAGRL